MKIAVVSNIDTIVYRFRFELVKRLIDLGHDVCIVTPGNTFIDEFKNIGCTICDIPVDRRGINPISDFKLLMAYRKYMKKEKPDLVLTFTIKPNIYAGFAAKRAKIPYAVNITGLGSAFERGGILTKLVVCMYKTALSKVDALFCQNSGDMDIIKKFCLVKDEKIHLLNGSGVNIDNFTYVPYPEDDGNIKFLFVGRVMKEKGVDELFIAAEKIKKEYSKAQFDFIGGFEENYAARIEELVKNNIINYHGQVKEPKEYYAKSDCIVLPSWHEGMSNALLEGAATGRALIASDVHGCKEAIIDEESGYVCKVKDADSLFLCLKKFIEMSYADRAKMGICGRKLMEEKFDRERVVDEIIKNITVFEEKIK